MTDNVTNELLLGHLKAIQSKLADHDEQFELVHSELRALKAHVAGLVQSDLTRDTEHALLTRRVERIERRLEISDGH